MKLQDYVEQAILFAAKQPIDSITFEICTYVSALADSRGIPTGESGIFVADQPSGNKITFTVNLKTKE